MGDQQRPVGLVFDPQRHEHRQLPRRSNAGDLWSYGVTGGGVLHDRALGSVVSGSATLIHFGLRFTIDTAAMFTNFTATYTGER